MSKRTDKTIAAIVVMLLNDNELIECFTFNDDDEGNIAAEQKFKDLALTNNEFQSEDLEDLDSYLEEGTITSDDVTIYITHT